LTNSATNKTYFNKDLQLEIKFTRTIKAILGNQFIYKDNIEDLENGTDFLLLGMQPFKIGVRLRRHKYFLSFPNEFTIRWKRPSGVLTEIHKIMQGKVDYILYGFVSEDESQIIKYFIGNLEVFRNTDVEPIIKPNYPLDSWLAIYKITQFPDTFIEKMYP